MIVKTWVEFSQEVDVQVSIAEVIGAIGELADGDQAPMILDCINSVHGFLRRIPDERIAALNEKQRQVIGAALHAQAARFNKPE